MLKPLRSDEFGLLVKYLVWISKKFNETHGLPADDNSVYMNWIDLLSKVPFSFQSYSNVIKSSFRMNLRFLAHVRVLCFLSFVIVIGLYQMNIISWTSTSVISGLLLSLFWYGRFTGVLPWQYY